jgi:hypothetical protein
MRRRIGFEPTIRNFLSTTDATAVFTVVDPAQRLVNTRNPHLAPPFGGKRHLLALKRIHPRQAPDALLVERDRIAAFRRLRAQGQQLLQFLLQARAKAHGPQPVPFGVIVHVKRPRWRWHLISANNGR